LTKDELSRLRISCSVAAEAFEIGRNSLRPGIYETEAAQAFRGPLSVYGTLLDLVQRADGHTFCMSGPNGFKASAAFQRSRSRQLQLGDLVLIHCNSYVDGFWTDITRTYCLAQPDEQQLEFYDIIFAAREAALKRIKPGARAADVDDAARAIFRERGLEHRFKHALGHGVGFTAIDHNARPRLHPASDDVLEEGMVFNVEPAIYIENIGGIRHCDMVVVTESGAELLTPFHSDLSQLVISEVVVNA
jgi:Xaa-Pro dipeptidase